MKKDEFIQLKGSDLKELKLKAKTLREEIANLVLDKNMKKLKDLKAIYKKKKDLAKVLTVGRQKELLVQLESEASKADKKAEVVADSLEESKTKKEKGQKLSKNKE